MRRLLFSTLAAILAAGSAPALADQPPGWLEGQEAGPHAIRVLQVDDHGSVWGVAHIDGYVLPSWWRISGMEPLLCSTRHQRASAMTTDAARTQSKSNYSDALSSSDDAFAMASSVVP